MKKQKPETKPRPQLEFQFRKSVTSAWLSAFGAYFHNYLGREAWLYNYGEMDLSIPLERIGRYIHEAEEASLGFDVWQIAKEIIFDDSSPMTDLIFSNIFFHNSNIDPWFCASESQLKLLRALWLNLKGEILIDFKIKFMNEYFSPYHAARIMILIRDPKPLPGSYLKADWTAAMKSLVLPATQLYFRQRLVHELAPDLEFDWSGQIANRLGKAAFLLRAEQSEPFDRDLAFQDVLQEATWKHVYLDQAKTELDIFCGPFGKLDAAYKRIRMDPKFSQKKLVNDMFAEFGREFENLLIRPPLL